MNTASLVSAALATGDLATATTLRDAWCARQYGTLSDWEIADWSMNVDRVIIEHSMFCCCDHDEPCVDAERRLLDALTHEMDRRTREGVTVSKDSDPSIERDLAPFGPEWEREAEARMSVVGHIG
jgi:hypothetical protein